jgi:hypothetical protein
MKLEEIKLKDLVGKAEIFHKKFLTNLKMNNAESPTRYKQKSKYEETYDHHNVLLDLPRKINISKRLLEIMRRDSIC